MLVSAAILFQFLMFAELLALIEMLLVDGPLWAVAPLGALAALPALIESDSRALRPAIALLAVAAAGLSAGALVVSRSSAERPLAFGIEYFRDLSSKDAKWAVVSKQAPLPDGFPGNWTKGILPFNGRTRWIAEAPTLTVPAGSATIVSDKEAGSGRRLILALSPGGADTVSLRFPKEAKVLALGLPGSPLQIPATSEPEKALLRCSGRSCEGLQIEVSSQLIAPERAIVGSEYFRYDELPANLQRLRQHRSHLRGIITHRFPVDRIDEAFATFLAGDCGKVVVEQEKS